MRIKPIDHEWLGNSPRRMTRAIAKHKCPRAKHCFAEILPVMSTFEPPVRGPACTFSLSEGKS